MPSRRRWTCCWNDPFHSIDLNDKHLTGIKTPLVWTLGGRGRPLTLYPHDIRFE